MRPITGWVSDITGSELEIRLKTGPVITIPRRPDLRWGDSVRVFYDYERMEPGQILSLNSMHEMGETREAPWTEEDHPWDTDDLLAIIEGL